MLNIDWALLRDQKQALLQAIDISPPAMAEALTGLLHLIDHVQDEAARTVGERAVFGDPEEPTSSTATR